MDGCDGRQVGGWLNGWMDGRKDEWDCICFDMTL